MIRLVAAAIAAALFTASGAAAQAVVDDPVPQPPAGVVAGYIPPAQDEAGYVTPNRGLSGGEAAWHLRAAFNVAALGCPGGETDQAAAYNALLAAARAPLADAASATEAAYQHRHGAEWRARFDDDMTRLYNFFAQPAAHEGFCTAAAALLREVSTVEPAAFPAFVAGALPRIEAPFTRFFAAYDGYRANLAAWRSRHPAVTIAALDVTRLRVAAVGPQP